jgi:hypothetical protein
MRYDKQNNLSDSIVTMPEPDNLSLSFFVLFVIPCTTPLASTKGVSHAHQRSPYQFGSSLPNRTLLAPARIVGIVIVV